MNRTLYSRCLVFTIGIMTVTPLLVTAEPETMQRTVQGTVMAANPAVDPPTIVVKVLLPSKEELIGGARVPTDTKIMRGKRAIKMVDLKVGEAAALTYLKSPDGLIARSIHVQ